MSSNPRWKQLGAAAAELRGRLRAPASADRQAIEQLAMAHEATIRLLEGKPAKKVVVVPGKLVNVVA